MGRYEILIVQTSQIHLDEPCPGYISQFGAVNSFIFSICVCDILYLTYSYSTIHTRWL